MKTSLNLNLNYEEVLEIYLKRINKNQGASNLNYNLNNKKLNKSNKLYNTLSIYPVSFIEKQSTSNKKIISTFNNDIKDFEQKFNLFQQELKKENQIKLGTANQFNLKSVNLNKNKTKMKFWQSTIKLNQNNNNNDTKIKKKRIKKKKIYDKFLSKWNYKL